MIKEKLGAKIDGWIHAVFPFLFKRRLNPNALTLFGTVVCLSGAILLANGYFALGGWVLLAGGFFDLVDGVVARHFGCSSTFGAFLDSTMDRLVDMSVLLGILIHYGAAGQTQTAVLTGIVLVGTVMTSYTKARAELHIPKLPGGFLERGERIGLIAAGAVFHVMVPVLWLLAAGTTITVVQRFAAAYRQMELLDSGAAQPAEQT